MLHLFFFQGVTSFQRFGVINTNQYHKVVPTSEFRLKRWLCCPLWFAQSLMFLAWPPCFRFADLETRGKFKSYVSINPLPNIGDDSWNVLFDFMGSKFPPYSCVNAWSVAIRLNTNDPKNVWRLLLAAHPLVFLWKSQSIATLFLCRKKERWLWSDTNGDNRSSASRSKLAAGDKFKYEESSCLKFGTGEKGQQLSQKQTDVAGGSSWLSLYVCACDTCTHKHTRAWSTQAARSAPVYCPVISINTLKRCNQNHGRIQLPLG